MKYIFTCLAGCLLFSSISLSQNAITDKLFYSSYKVYENLRYPSGVYRAKLPLSGTANEFAAISVTGMGLVSLCIADTMHWITNARFQALKTLKALQGYISGFHPKRNPSGFFYQYLDPVTGENAGTSPFSTIDNAVLVSGALFCRNYFNDDSITFYVNKLWDSYKWNEAIADADNAKMYLSLDSVGKGQGNPTRLYNEYIQVAWLARGQECYTGQSGIGSKLWKKFGENPDSIPVKPVYQGIEMLGVFANTYQPEHVMTMPHFLCHQHTISARYIYYMNNMRKADSLWWRTTNLTKSYEWGMSAGSGITKSYRVDAINENEDTIVSPHALAGFIPVFPKAKNDLINLYKNNKGVYSLPSDTSLRILWRYSPAHPAWKADVVQGVDFATFLFGLASLPEYLGIHFFETYNDFFSPEATISFTPASLCEGNCVNFKNDSPKTNKWKWTFSGSNTISSTVQNPSSICYTKAGTFTVTLSDSNQCSSKLNSINILVNPLPLKPVIIQNANELTTSGGSSYQWYLNNQPVLGAGQPKLAITQSGIYVVCIKNASGCEVCSDPYSAIANDIPATDLTAQLMLFPNPAQHEVMIAGFGKSESLRIQFVNAQGQCVKTEIVSHPYPGMIFKCDLQSLSEGIYSVVLWDNHTPCIRKLILVK